MKTRLPHAFLIAFTLCIPSYDSILKINSVDKNLPLYKITGFKDIVIVNNR